MGKPKITGALTPADLSTMKANLDANKVLIGTFAVNLTPAERRSGQRMGPISIGYAQDALQTAEEHPSIIPGDFSITDFEMSINLYNALDEVENHGSEYFELVTDTKMAVGIQIMQMANRLYAQAKISSKYDTALGEIVKELARRYKRSSSRQRTTFTVTAKGSIEVPNVIPGTIFANNGKTIVRFKAGAELASKFKSAFTDVYPGDAEKIPDGWTIIYVENVSETSDGSFAVMIR